MYIKGIETVYKGHTYSVTLKLYIKGGEGVMLDNLSIIQFYGFLSHFLIVYFFLKFSSHYLIVSLFRSFPEAPRIIIFSLIGSIFKNLFK